VLEAAAANLSGHGGEYVEHDVTVVRQHAPEAAELADERLDVFRRLRTVEHAGLADIDQEVLLFVD
jgi:hypothetical protein